MATVGHTLTGLSLGVGPNSRPSGKFIAAIWMGLLVLFAHLVDLIEWMLLLVAPRTFSAHTVTNSPWLVMGVLAGVLLFLAACRVRQPVLYAFAALAVLSHVLLDLRSIRLSLANVYGWSGNDGFPSLLETMASEFWLFGGLFALAALFHAARQRGVKRPARQLAAVLGVVAVVGAVIRHPIAWAPAYALCLLHALLLSRQRVKWSLAWNLVPLIPLFALVGIELYAWRLESHAASLLQSQDYQRAARAYQQALDIPTRSSRVSVHVNLSTCLFKIDDLDGAERQLLRVVDDVENPYWPRLMLAYLYVAPKTRGTSFHRPQESQRLLQSIADDPRSGRTGQIAHAQLQKWTADGTIPPDAP